MKRNILLLCAVLVMAPYAAAAQDPSTSSGRSDGARQGAGAGAGAGAGSGASARGEQSSSQTTSTTKDGKTTTTTIKTDDVQFPKYSASLTNVQIELTLTDQQGTRAPEKKTVSMIVANRSWGKIRSAAQVMTPGEAPYVVELNVDARPSLSVDGPIQLEMTLVYAPVKSEDKDAPRQRPSGINQSQTIAMTSGKSMIIAQAADPATDRKVVVEVKATILK